MKTTEQQIKDFLLDTNLVTEGEFEQALKKAKKSKKKIDDVLVEQGIISPEDIGKLNAYILGIPFVGLEDEKIQDDILRLVPEPIARKRNIVAYKKQDRNLEVAMLDPYDLETIEFIKKKSGLNVKSRLTNKASIQHVLKQYQKSLQAEFGEIIKKESQTFTEEGLFAVKKERGIEKKEEDLKKMAEDLPIIKIVNTLLRHAILQKASDIHIEPQEKEVVVRYRIDGILHDAMVLPLQVAAGIIARIKVLSNLRLDEHRLPQDGRFSIETENYKTSFRVSTFPVYEGEKAALRLLPEESHGYTLEKLGFHGLSLERVHESIRKTIGLVLATGPTGSGKTTTLYTILDILNTPGVNIATIEDPIEYHMPRINQTQIRPDIGFSFANGLRSLVRQDPDIIMVGEIRDNETASLAINAALTGHLVFSTLHTNSAAGALPRLIDMQVEPFLLVSTVNCVIAQRLVRKLCDPKEKYFLKKSELEQLSKEVDLNRVLETLKEEKVVPTGATLSSIPFYRPKPSANCPDGYSDRIAIHEVLIMSQTLKELVMKNASIDVCRPQAMKENMRTMLEDGIFLAARGITSIEEVLRVTRE